MSDNIYGDDAVEMLTADEFVPVTVQVHVDDLASFHQALADWWRSVDGEGAKGRIRVA